MDISQWRNQDQNENQGTHEIEFLQSIKSMALEISKKTANTPQIWSWASGVSKKDSVRKSLHESVLRLQFRPFQWHFVLTKPLPKAQTEPRPRAVQDTVQCKTRVLQLHCAGPLDSRMQGNLESTEKERFWTLGASAGQDPRRIDFTT